ncbi:hypothetical protein HMPREF0645_1082 [Hallella bergensis DSM 17361]|uniref:Uncharacterized protein n=1 Tax=Hallella bergensis DSM 17361 TaxID=585502 RepID=D1PVU7_9BACT|nr:hypothetical protein HMPREF0645_1082 [Hallella bergensis DSM 17361]
MQRSKYQFNLAIESSIIINQTSINLNRFLKTKITLCYNI